MYISLLTYEYNAKEKKMFYKNGRKILIIALERETLEPTFALKRLPFSLCKQDGSARLLLSSRM